MSHAPTSTEKRRPHTTVRAAACAALVAIALAVGAVAFPSTASAAAGDHFSFAPVSTEAPDPVTDAPAFPGEKAFWAGVCDLHAGTATVGILPADPFPGCIDHPPTMATDNGGSVQIGPPLALGVAPNLDPADGGGSGPNGWIRNGTFAPASGPGWRLADVHLSGAHPDGSASFWFSRAADQPKGQAVGLTLAPDGSPRNITAKLPPGVVGNPNAVPKCPSQALNVVPTMCPPKTQVGVSTISANGFTGVFPVYNVEPRDGKAAEFMISGAGVSSVLVSNVPVVARVRTEGDFGVDTLAVQLPAGLAVHSQTFTFWGVPWAASHDRYRPVTRYCHPTTGTDPFESNAWQTSGMSVQGLVGGVAGGCSQEPQSYDPSWGPIRPFISTQTECSSENPVTRIEADNWQRPDVVATADSVVPLLEGCEDVDFDAGFDLQTTSRTADSASGLDVDLSVEQNNDPPLAKRFNPHDDDPASAIAHWKSTAGLARSHLKDSVVTLPEGFSVNPSAATGLAGCSDSEIGLRDASSSPPLFNNGDPFDGKASDGVECPQGSVIGTAKVTTPLLEEELSGQVVLGVPKSTDPGSGEMLRMFIVLRNRERGLLAKIYGTATADPATGRLKATFENNPRVPFDKLELSFKGGDRGVLATPRACGGPNEWSSSFSPWSGNAPVSQGGAFAVDQRCSSGFAPKLDSGMDTQAARANGTFSFKFSRQDGEQYLRGLTARLPQGLLASVKDVPLCTTGQAAFEQSRTGSQADLPGGCPAASKIGLVDAKAGSGDPFVLERKGEVFLTEGYKGGEYGLLVKVRPVAGPFRNDVELDPIVVRQAIHVDRTTAQVTAISDPFPLIHHGVPLRVREVTVLVDRPAFMLNPSDCATKQVAATIQSDQGTGSGLSQPFNTSGCAGLAFKPKLSLALTGRKQVKTGQHPGIRAVVTQQGIPEAGIEKAVVRLPKSLALDVNNAQALCEYADGIKSDIENHCPKGSIVGRARAVSPLLNDPLVGNVYFVKNIRIDSKTGNQIRTLPMIVVALRGEVNVNLKGESDTQKGKLVNTFANVPDAPISQFNLNINGGKTGIIAVTRTRRSLINLCATGRQIAEADMDGQNGRRHDFDVAMRKPCTKAATRKAKRAAKRNAQRGR